MSVLKPTLFGNNTIKMNRTCEVYTSFTQDRPKKLLSGYQFRRGTLSPLHLSHHSREESDPTSFSLTIRSTQGPGQSPKEKPLIKLNKFEEKPKDQLEILSEAQKIHLKVKNFGSSLEHSVQSEKITTLDHSWKINPNTLMTSQRFRSSVPSRHPRKKLKALEKEVKLKVNGVMKLFSPRNDNYGLAQGMFNFK
jgi:hypothetical protein